MIFNFRVCCIADLVEPIGYLFFSCSFYKIVELPVAFVPNVSYFRLEDAVEYGYRPCAVTGFIFCIDIDLPLV